MKKTGKRKVNIGRPVLLVLVALLAGTAVYNWNARNLTGDQMPMPLGYGVSVVLSGSMEPTLYTDDLVVIRKTQDVAVGDVIVFQDGSDLVIHRIVKIDADRITTQGDNNNLPDASISRAAVKGVYLWRVPGVGALVHFIRKPFVMLLLLLLCIFMAERSLRREKNADDRELTELKIEIEKLKQDIQK